MDLPSSGPGSSSRLRTTIGDKSKFSTPTLVLCENPTNLIRGLLNGAGVAFFPSSPSETWTLQRVVESVRAGEDERTLWRMRSAVSDHASPARSDTERGEGSPAGEGAMW